MRSLGKIIITGLLLPALSFAASPTGSVNTYQKGETTIHGSVYDPDSPSASLNLHLWIDNTWANYSWSNGSNYSLNIPAQYLTDTNAHVAEVRVKDANSNDWFVVGSTNIVKNQLPTGSVNPYQAGNTTVTGTAADPDSPSTAVNVHLYGDGVFQDWGWSNGSQFSLNIPPSFLTDGNAHTLEVRAKDTSINEWVILGSATIGSTSPPLNQLPTGSVNSYQAGNTTITGTVTDPDSSSSPVNVHLYGDGVFQDWGWSSGSQFSLNIPSSFLTDGNTHTLEVRAKDTSINEWVVLGSTSVGTSPPPPTNKPTISIFPYDPNSWDVNGIPVVKKGSYFPLVKGNIPQSYKYRDYLSVTAHDEEDGNLTSRIKFFKGSTQVTSLNQLPLGLNTIRVSVEDNDGQVSNIFQNIVVVGNRPAEWSGPSSDFIVQNGATKLKVCSQSSCKVGEPVFLAIPVANKKSEWETFISQVKLLSNTENIVPVVEVNIDFRHSSSAWVDSSNPNRLIDTISQSIRHLYAATPNNPPYMLFRTYLHEPEDGGFSSQFSVAKNINGEQVETSVETLSDAWISKQEQEIEKYLKYVDYLYPEKVIGFKFKYLDGGEWFTRGVKIDSEGKVKPAEGPPYPWFLQHQSEFYFSDYSSNATTSFCNFLNTVSCTPPSPSERNIPNHNSIFTDPTILSHRTISKFNEFESKRVVNAIKRLALKSKQVMNNKGITATFYGYLFGLAETLTYSRHTALSELLEDSNIDAIVSPYSYRSARELGNAMLPQGPDSSPLLYNKVWMTEDDTRTHLADSSDTFKKSNSLYDSRRLLWRNTLTSKLRGGAIYYLDLFRDGWFDSNEIWNDIDDILEQSSKVEKNTVANFTPEIAVFLDELSPSYTRMIDPAGEQTYSFAHTSLPGAIETISKIGAPIRYYLLSDLLEPNFPFNEIKLAIFLNTYNIPEAIRDKINLLKSNNRSLIFSFAAGYLKGDNKPSTEYMADLTGFNISHHTTPRNALEVKSLVPSLFGDYNLGIYISGNHYPVDDWYTITGSTPGGQITRLAMMDGNKTALARTNHGTYKSYYSVIPGMPTEFYRYVASDAKVLLNSKTGDIVEANMNTMLLNSPLKGTRTIKFPNNTTRVYKKEVNTLGSTTENLFCSGTCSSKDYTTSENNKLTIFRIQ